MPRPVREVPWLEQREGVYNVRWYEPPTEEAKRRNPQAKGTTKRLGLRTRNPAEAAARYAAFLSTGYHKTVDTAGQLTIAAALEQYTEEHVLVNTAAPRRAAAAVTKLVEFFGDAPLASINIPACRSYANARRKLGITNSTIRRELVVLRAAAQHAVDWERHELLPRFELPAEEDDGQEVPWFSQEELSLLRRKLAETIDLGSPAVKERTQRLQDFIDLAYYWGARRNSVEALEVGQVQLDRGVVNLQKKGEQVTKKRRGIVPIFPEQRETLERRLAGAADGFLFGRGYTSYHMFRTLCEQCGLEEGRRHPHMLRHSRATHMLMAGEPPYKVAKLLGDTVATVEKVYGHFSPEFLAS